MVIKLRRLGGIDSVHGTGARVVHVLDTRPDFDREDASGGSLGVGLMMRGWTLEDSTVIDPLELTPELQDFLRVEMAGESCGRSDLRS